MPPVVIIAVLLVAAAAVALVALTAASHDRGPPRAVGAGVGVSTAVVLVVAAGLVGTVVVLGSARSRTEGPSGPSANSTSTTSEQPGATPRALESAQPPVGLGPEVRLENVADDDRLTRFSETPSVLGGLESATVLRVVAGGFPSHDEAIAEQCVGGRTTTCVNRIPVQFDADGRARFQYLVTSDVTPSTTCTADGAPCTLVVRSERHGARASVQTVFGGDLPPAGTLEVTPRSGLQDGQVVRVEARGLPPGAEAIVTTCAAPATSGERRCALPATSTPFEIGADGSATIEVVVSRGPLGRERVTCDRDQACALALVGGAASVRAPVVPITFAAQGGVAYEPTRLLAGLATMALLLSVAALLLVRTDWAPVGEAAAPEIDDAEYADLDAIVAALPGGSEDDPVDARI